MNVRKSVDDPWTPIDNTLSRSAGAIVNGAGVTNLQLPTTLQDPVKLVKGSDWMSLKLTGAAPAAASIKATKPLC